MVFSIYKRKWKKNGKTIESMKWYGKYRIDGMSKTISVKLNCSDKQVALSKLQKIYNEAEREAAGLLAPKPLREAAQMPLLQLLEEYLSDLKSTGCNPKYIRMVKTRLTALFQKCNWQYLPNITSESFNRWRSEQTSAPKTINDYLGATSSFLNWLIKNNRYTFNPLKNVVKIAPRKIRFRRALTLDELKKLISKGEHRLVYWVAATTGLRASEIKSLQWGDIHQEGENAWFAVRASTTKNKKEATTPILQDLFQELIKTRPTNYRPSDLIFASVPRNRRFRLDLKSCSIPYHDGQGRCGDFHSLRVTYATLLQKTGAAPRVVQELMRHSDPRLTHQTYTDATQMPIFDAVQKLPTLTSPVDQLTPELTPTLVPQGHSEFQFVTVDKTQEDLQTALQEAISHVLSRGVTLCQKAEKIAGAGFEPAAFRL